jgi:hypothetical protein
MRMNAPVGEPEIFLSGTAITSPGYALQPVNRRQRRAVITAVPLRWISTVTGTT